MSDSVFHIHFFAVFPQSDVCPPGSGGLELLADWQEGDFACLKFSGRHTAVPFSRVPVLGHFLKNELIRKFWKSLKNQCVDSNHLVCTVNLIMPKTGKIGGKQKVDRMAMHVWAKGGAMT